MDETKECKKCGRDKPLTAFDTFKSTKKGQEGTKLYENICRKCADDTAENQDRRALMLEETLNKKCYSIYQMCGFGCDDDSTIESDGTTAYLRLMQKLNDGGVNLEEE